VGLGATPRRPKAARDNRSFRGSRDMRILLKKDWVCL
jgi:hypothetical protein